MTDHENQSDSGPGPHAAADARPPMGDPSAGSQARPLRVQVPLLVVERDKRAVDELVGDHGVDRARAEEYVEAFGRCNHFEAWHLMLDPNWGPGMDPWIGKGFLERHGYWPIGQRAPDAVSPIDCTVCGLEIHAGEPCGFVIARDERFWIHSRCHV